MRIHFCRWSKNFIQLFDQNFILSLSCDRTGWPKYSNRTALNFDLLLLARLHKVKTKQIDCLYLITVVSVFRQNCNSSFTCYSRIWPAYADDDSIFSEQGTYSTRRRKLALQSWLRQYSNTSVSPIHHTYMTHIQKYQAAYITTTHITRPSPPPHIVDLLCTGIETFPIFPHTNTFVVCIRNPVVYDHQDKKKHIDLYMHKTI